LRKAQHDEEFVASLGVDPGRFTDWAVTGLFYSAVHYIEAYFARGNRHSGDHRARDSEIWRDGQLKRLYEPYNELKNHSITARYLVRTPTAQDLADSRQSLRAIKTEILKLV
jgi:hypothetical protein